MPRIGISTSGNVWVSKFIGGFFVTVFMGFFAILGILGIAALIYSLT
jgi:hypothetical protein